MTSLFKSVSEPMELEDGERVWAKRDDGSYETMTYIDEFCSFQNPCGTDEGQYGWGGKKISTVTHYVRLKDLQVDECQ